MKLPIGNFIFWLYRGGLLLGILYVFTGIMYFLSGILYFFTRRKTTRSFSTKLMMPAIAVARMVQSTISTPAK